MWKRKFEEKGASTEKVTAENLNSDLTQYGGNKQEIEVRDCYCFRQKVSEIESWRKAGYILFYIYC